MRNASLGSKLVIWPQKTLIQRVIDHKARLLRTRVVGEKRSERNKEV